MNFSSRHNVFLSLKEGVLILERVLILGEIRYMIAEKDQVYLIVMGKSVVTDKALELKKIDMEWM